MEFYLPKGREGVRGTKTASRSSTLRREASLREPGVPPRVGVMVSWLNLSFFYAFFYPKIAKYKASFRALFSREPGI